MSVTEVAYSSLDYAFNYFNEHLFGGELPDSCLLTLQRKGDNGYFSPDKFKSRTDTTKAHEISLNPDKFDHKSDVEILAVLVHQMCHFWEWEYYKRTQSKEPRRGYHSQRWANKMIRCGLMPSSTGQPKGKQTGTHVSQYMLQDGLFDWACRRLLSDGFKFHWESLEEKLFQQGDSEKSKKQDNRNKVKYTCPICQQNAWAKPNAKLDCGACRDRWGRVERMVSDQAPDDEDNELSLDPQQWSPEELNSFDPFPISVPVGRQLKLDKRSDATRYRN